MNCQTSAHIGQREPSLSIEHYENFPVASWLCPPALRPAVIALYHFARTADDLADEGDAARAVRVQALRDYRADLNALAAGRAPSARWTAVFAPLARELHRLDATLLHDLLDAFEQDLAPPRYRDRDHLLDYCRRSANPIGRLLLGLYGVDDTASLRRSDAICSALQLINFWQDFSRDGPRGRLYVPQADLDRHGVSAEAVLACQDGPAARALIRDLCDWARTLMQEGAPLALSLPGRAGWELRLVVQGGLLILDKIAARGHDSPVHRPKIEALDLPRLAWRALTMRATS
ncbi:MAG: squalene synthase HpnC [Proteobacteria bacterium]|jgi:squalene synthase HpnC|nr:squalene synthase HpnC [Methylibium sp.]MBY0368935.1 squalene synthase HpnC [Burkholderiaceae bacterium]MCH8857005.1 squalene synthase HpnC [Pseudomonadota bacterium]